MLRAFGLVLILTISALYLFFAEFRDKRRHLLKHF